jgi:DNA primase
MKPGRSKDRTQVETIRATADIPAILSKYGAEIAIQSSENIRCTCVLHGGSNPTSLSYDFGKNVFHCFGECGFKGDVFDFIQTMEKCSFPDAVKIASEYASKSYPGVYSAAASVEVKPWVTAMEKAYFTPDRNKAIEPTLVERSMRYKPNPYVLQGKFTEATISYFEVGYCTFNDYFMNRAIIPIHDEHGLLVGYSGRDMSGTSTSVNKYRIKKGFKKGKCLYNLHRAKSYISPSSPLVVVEGFGQAWRLHEAGFRSVVALMGKELSEEQADLIWVNTTSLILGLDFDEPGVEATKKIIDRFQDKLDIRVMTSELDSTVDIADMSISQVRDCYSNSIPDYLWVNTVYKQLPGGSNG